MKNLFLSILLVVLAGTIILGQSQKVSRMNNLQGTEGPQMVFGPVQDAPLASIFESFETPTFPPTGWSLYSPTVNMWRRITVGTSPIPGWTGGACTAPPLINGISSGIGQAFVTWDTVATSNDEWLITAQITNVQANDSLYFWLRKYSSYADTMDIKISTTTNIPPAAFTINVATIGFVGSSVDTGWVFKRIKIGHLVTPGQSIYIAFRERVVDNYNNGAALFVDFVNVGTQVIPVEFTSFVGNANENSVVLNWSTASEKNNHGFQVEKKFGNDFAAIGFVNGKGTTTQTQNYSFVDKNVSIGKAEYRLKQVDFDGSSTYSKVVEVEITKPSEFALNQNYPNPFNPTTKINFSLAADSKVTLSIYNVLGQKVVTLINSNLNAGIHSAQFDASGMQSGIYFAKIEAVGNNGQKFSSIKKMTLMK
jgi:hypothetical protein